MPEHDPKYKIIEKRADGGYGDIYLAKQINLNERPVAIKVIRADSIQPSTARAHAKALAGIHHPNVVYVIDLIWVAVEENGEVVEAVAMEWLEGKAIGDLLIAGDIPLTEVVRIGKGIYEGLRHMHGRGIFHCDLNIGNVLVSDEFVKIIDVAVNEETTAAMASTTRIEVKRVIDIDFLCGYLRMMLHTCSANTSSITKEIVELSKIKTLEGVGEFLGKLEEVSRGIVPTPPADSLEELRKEGLKDVDIAVLKLVGDALLEKNHPAATVAPLPIVAKLQEQGFAEDVVSDSFEFLGEKGLFREAYQPHFNMVRLNEAGFDLYLRAFYPDRNDAVDKVARAVGLNKLDTDSQIAHATGVSPVLVMHFLDLMASNDYFKVSRTNSGYSVYNETSKLRRALEGLDPI
jgi:serine/threonine protein kinase